MEGGTGGRRGGGGWDRQAASQNSADSFFSSADAFLDCVFVAPTCFLIFSIVYLLWCMFVCGGGRSSFRGCVGGEGACVAKAESFRVQLIWAPPSFIVRACVYVCVCVCVCACACVCVCV